MQRYVDLVSDKELLTDCFGCADKDKSKEYLIGFKMSKISTSCGIDDSLIGGNASADCAQEQYEDQEETKMYCSEFGIEKIGYMPPKDLKKYIITYMKKCIKKLQEDSCPRAKERLERLKAGNKEVITQFVDMFNPDDSDIFAHADTDFESANLPLFIGKWDESGNLTLWTCCDALRAERC
jgi:hypothetical protein